jgi:hypothetical protein
MRNIVLIILVFSSAFLMGMSQGIYYHYPSSFFIPDPESYFSRYQMKDQNQHNQLQIHFDIGTSFSNIGGFGSMFTNYISPQISYPLSEKLNLQVGGILSTNFLTGQGTTIPSFTGNLKNNTFSQYLLYAKGIYKLSDKLEIRSSVIKSINNAPDLFKMNSNMLNLNYESYSLGFDYKLSNSVRFGANFNIINDKNPYYLRPFGNKINGISPFYNPYYPHW